MDILEEIRKKVEEGSDEEAEELTRKALGEGVEAKKILDNGLINAMEIIGEKYSIGEIYVPEMMMSAMAMKASMEVLKPGLIEARVEPIGKCVIGTVADDLHDIGQGLVSMMLEGAGFEVHNLGTDVSSEDFIEAVKEHNAQILGLSAMLTTTMMNMEEVINLLKEAGLRDKVKILIGGAPVNKEFAQEIGADGYGKDATEAVEVAKKLISQKI